MENSERFVIPDPDCPATENNVHFIDNSRDYIQTWANAVEFFAKRHEDRTNKNGRNSIKPAIIHSGLLFGTDTYIGGYDKNQKKTAVIDTLADAVKTGIDVYMLLDGGATNSYGFLNESIQYAGNNDTAQLLKKVGVKTLLVPGEVGWSKHDKGTVFINDQREVETAFIGIDIARHREDGPLHKKEDPKRHPGVQPTHDNGLMIEGPAAADVADFFIMRWNNHHSGEDQIDAGVSRVAADPKKDVQSVQIFRTDHKNNKFTVYDSYVNAIDNAKEAIYIQDQYFWPDTTSKGFENKKSIRDALKGAIERGVAVVALVPPDDMMESKIFEDSQKFQRTEDARFLNKVAEEKASSGDFSIVHRPGVYVHAKTMIVDGEAMFGGSCNMNTRSMVGDDELTAMVVGKKWVTNVREKLFELHSGIPELRQTKEPSPLNDMKVASQILKHAAMMGEGKLAVHSIEPLSRPRFHDGVMSIINRPGRGGASR